jgi:hypothetical protein
MWDDVPRPVRWLAYAVFFTIALTLITSIVQILGGIFGWS